jgi:hypothetical protein
VRRRISVRGRSPFAPPAANGIVADWAGGCSLDRGRDGKCRAYRKRIFRPLDPDKHAPVDDRIARRRSRRTKKGTGDPACPLPLWDRHSTGSVVVAETGLECPLPRSSGLLRLPLVFVRASGVGGLGQGRAALSLRRSVGLAFFFMSRQFTISLWC